MKSATQMLASALALLISVSTTARADASDGDYLPKRQGAVLSGVQQIQIHVSTAGNGKSLVPQKDEKLHHMLSKKLSSAGLTVGEGVVNPKEAAATFVIDRHITLIKSSSGQPVGLTYEIDAFLVDMVKPERRPAGKSARGIVWKSNGAFGYISTRELPHLENVVSSITDEFLADWRAAEQADMEKVAITPIEFQPQDESIDFTSSQGEHYFGARPTKDPPRVNVETALQLNRCNEQIRVLKLYIQHQHQQLLMQQQQLAKLQRKRQNTEATAKKLPQPKPTADKEQIGSTQTALDLFR